MRKPILSAVKFDRVSSKDQRDGFSLAAQKTAGDKYAKDNNLKIVKEWSVDESASKEDDRKYFFALIDYTKNHNIRDVIFDKVDRACRGFKSAVVIEDLVGNYDVRFHFTRDHLVIDKNSPPHEKLRFYLGTILGKYYIDNLKTEIRKGLDARLEAGYWNKKAPFGYQNIRVGPRKTATVIIDERTGPFIKEMFELYATGNYSQKYFVKQVKEKFPELNTNGRLIETVLSNPFYYGVMKVKGKLYKAVHEPLITKGLFDACQKIRAIRATGHSINKANEIPKPFMGFMKCGACNHAITGEIKRKSNGRIYVYYHCANKYCPEKSKNTNQNKIEKQVLEAFECFKAFTPEMCRYIIDSIKEKLMDLDYYTEKKSSELAIKRQEIKKNIAKLEKLHQEGILTDDEYKEVNKIKRIALAEVTNEIVAHQKADLATYEEGFRIIELLHKVYDFMKLGDNLLEKVRLAKMVLSNPILEDGTLRYDYEKPFDVLIELAGGRVKWS